MTPIVDVSRCTRSEDCVVLVLSPPQSIHDVIDQYEIHYCSEEQKSLEIEVIYIYIFKYFSIASEGCCSRDRMVVGLKV